jgi:hypothetical protein
MESGSWKEADGYNTERGMQFDFASHHSDFVEHYLHFIFENSAEHKFSSHHESFAENLLHLVLERHRMAMRWRAELEGICSPIAPPTGRVSPPKLLGDGQSY